MKELDVDYLCFEGEKKGGDVVKYVVKVRVIGYVFGVFGVLVCFCLFYVYVENVIDGDINE